MATMQEAPAAAHAAVEKLGAGLLLCCGSQVLVLLRNSSHNHNTWGLPGGNADAEDGGDLLTTAKREASEELTIVPEFEVVGEVLTMRGKRAQKHYKVFVCSMSEEQRAAYKPVLNPEHSTWRWFELQDLRLRNDLHPVVDMLVNLHWDKLRASLALP